VGRAPSNESVRGKKMREDTGREPRDLVHNTLSAEGPRSTAGHKHLQSAPHVEIRYGL
jgi:hypothetical protein